MRRLLLYAFPIVLFARACEAAAGGPALTVPWLFAMALAATLQTFELARLYRRKRRCHDA